MELCRDCGHRNVGAIYSAECGSKLFAPSDPQRARLHGRPGPFVDHAIQAQLGRYGFLVALV